MRTLIRFLALLSVFFLALSVVLEWYDVSLWRPKLPKEVVESLDASASITLYSLQPWGGPDIPEWDFHGHHVLGHVELRGQQAKIAIEALNDAVSAGNANLISGCRINPRHAFRFKMEGDTYDILICYQCGQLEIFRNSLRLPFEGKISGKPEVLNRLLKAADIPLADNPDALNESYAEEAKTTLKKAEEGDAKAQNVIARMLMSGRGVKTDEAEGIKWLAKSLASSPDSPDFQIKLGSMYERGEDVTENYPAAMSLFRKAAAQGSAEAVYQIGELYELSDGVAKNESEAMTWFRKAAENGYVEAEFEIGIRYARGWRVKQDYLEALKWFQKAANQSHPGALDWMGNMYEKGWGVTKNPVEAYFWDRLAVEYGATSGMRVSVTLTSEQRAVVEKRLADWTAVHPKRGSH